MLSLIKSRNNTAEKDYIELLDYLTLYVNIQEALIDCIKIHIVNNEYMLSDLNGNVIFTFIESDDALIDILIILAPKRIQIYNTLNLKNNELMRTIIAIFKERVEINYNTDV